MIQISKTRISAADEKKLFEKYNVLGKILNKDISDDDLKKTLKLRDRIRTKLVENNVGLVYKYAHKNKVKTYVSNLEFDDLVQFGMVGLLKSIDGYDFNSGYYFSTYACQIIEKTIYRYINTTSRSIKIPEKEVMKFLRAVKESSDDSLDKFNKPEYLSMVILNTLFGENGSTEEQLEYVPFRVTPMDDLAQKLIHVDIEKMVKTLPPRDQTVVYHYFGVCGKKQMTVKELSEHMGYAKKTIYTLIESVCEKMKKRKHMLEGWQDYEES
jgi:RNA polymerase primary sigma factor